MKTSCSLASLAVVCTLIGAGPAAAVVTLGDGSYDIAFSVSENGTDFAGTASVSGSLDAVASDTLSDSSRFIDFDASLNSDLSLRLFIGALGASSFGYPLVGTFELTGLDLLVDGSPAAINGITFDAATTDIGQFADAGDFIAPTISFSGTSATIAFGFAGSGLAGDQPDIYFDITTAPVTTVPVPAAVWLFGSGLLGMIGIARRKKAT